MYPNAGYNGYGAAPQYRGQPGGHGAQPGMRVPLNQCQAVAQPGNGFALASSPTTIMMPDAGAEPLNAGMGAPGRGSGKGAPGTIMPDWAVAPGPILAAGNSQVQVQGGKGGGPWRNDPEQHRSQTHVIWGALDLDSQDSMAFNSTAGGHMNPYDSGNFASSGARKKIQNKRISTDGITFLDSMSSGGCMEEEGSDRPPPPGSYTFSAQAFNANDDAAAASQLQALKAGLQPGLQTRPGQTLARPYRGGVGDNSSGDESGSGAEGQAQGENGLGIQGEFAKKKKHKGKPRPCKGKRDKYRKHVEDLKARVEANPAEFDPDSVELPASVSAYERLRAKLVTRLKNHKETVLAERGQAPAAPV